MAPAIERSAPIRPPPRTPTRLGIITFSIYIPAKIAAYFYFGLMGVAVATSAFFAVNLVLQLVLLDRALGERVQAAA